MRHEKNLKGSSNGGGIGGRRLTQRITHDTCPEDVLRRRALRRISVLFDAYRTRSSSLSF
jgi:hypothetical protein